MDTQVKSILASKTFWVAVIQGCIGVIVAIGTQIPLVGLMLVVKSALDILLRAVTSQKVTFFNLTSVS